MQSLGWYARRLCAMGPAEVAARVAGAAREQRERLLLATRWGLRCAEARAGRLPAEALRPVHVPVYKGTWDTGLAAAWRDALGARADQLAQGRLSYFNLRDWHHGEPLNWNHDHGNGKAAPLSWASGIDYRSFAETGDCKYVWEPNRHQHLVVLGRAYRATGRRAYAEAVATQLGEWLNQCPYGRGMNWRSPLELGIRLINWAWALALIYDAEVLEEALRARLGRSIGLHVWEIARKYSRGSSANNHLIGEAAAVFIACTCWPGLPQAARRQAQAAEILETEILRQTAADGGPREQATAYLVFIAQFLLLAELTARSAGRSFSGAYGQRLREIFRFLAALREGGPELPQIGDSDDGYVLDLGGTQPSVEQWLGTAALVFDRAELAGAREVPETAAWLLGPRAAEREEQGAGASRDEPLVSREFADSGYCLLQSGRRGSADAISVLFDCGPLGYGPLAAHGHADALSFVLRVGGGELLVDPGTYDYFTYPRWRAYFRGTKAHNTITVDDADQSAAGGPFLWTRHARARRLLFEPRDSGGRVRAMHDGYRRLADPVVHARALELEGQRLRIEDELTARAAHRAEFRLHLAEHCRPVARGAGIFELQAPTGCATLRLDPQLEVALLRASLDPPGGWISRGYHQRTPTYTLVGRCEFTGTLRLHTELRVHPTVRASAAQPGVTETREEAARCGV